MTKLSFSFLKGDGNIRYYEIVDSSPWVHFLSQYLSGLPQVNGHLLIFSNTIKI